MFRQANPFDISFAQLGVLGQALHETGRPVRISGILERGYQLIKIFGI